MIIVNTWKVTGKKSLALRNLNFSEESPQRGPQIDNDFVLILYLCYIMF